MKTPIVIILTFQAVVWAYKAGIHDNDHEDSFPCLVMALLNIAALIMVTV